MSANFWVSGATPPTPTYTKFYNDAETGVALSPTFEHNGKPWMIARIPTGYKEIDIDLTSPCSPRVVAKKPDEKPKSTDSGPCNCGCKDSKKVEEKKKKKAEKDEKVLNEKTDMYRWHLVAHQTSKCSWCQFCQQLYL